MTGISIKWMINMIFVSVGTHKQQFNRLLKKIDELVEEKIIYEPVFAQTGYSDYTPKNFKFKDFLSIDEFDAMIKQCSLFITHAGEGNIGTALQFEKKMIIVPRLSIYKEHTNDHQLELANAIEKNGQGIVSDTEHLKASLKKVKLLKIKKTNHARGIISILEKSI